MRLTPAAPRAGAHPSSDGAASRASRAAFLGIAFCGALVGLALLLGGAGCAWSTRSGLPEHVKTISVPMFGNSTTDYNVETRLTRALRDAVMRDTRLKLVNPGGNPDAVLSGKIVSVVRRDVRDDKDDRPATMQVTVRARYSFYDENAARFLVQDADIESSDAASSKGFYNVSRDPRKDPEEAALDAAIDALASEIIRRTLGMW